MIPLNDKWQPSHVIVSVTLPLGVLLVFSATCDVSSVCLIAATTFWLLCQYVLYRRIARIKLPQTMLLIATSWLGAAGIFVIAFDDATYLKLFYSGYISTGMLGDVFSYLAQVEGTNALNAFLVVWVVMTFILSGFLGWYVGSVTAIKVGPCAVSFGLLLPTMMHKLIMLEELSGIPLMVSVVKMDIFLFAQLMLSVGLPLFGVPTLLGRVLRKQYARRVLPGTKSGR